MQFFIASQEQWSMASISRVLIFWPTWTTQTSPSHAADGNCSLRRSTVRISLVASSSPGRTQCCFASPSPRKGQSQCRHLRRSGVSLVLCWSASCHHLVSSLCKCSPLIVQSSHQDAQQNDASALCSDSFDRCSHRSQRELTHIYTVSSLDRSKIRERLPFASAA